MSITIEVTSRLSADYTTTESFVFTCQVSGSTSDDMINAIHEDLIEVAGHYNLVTPSQAPF